MLKKVMASALIVGQLGFVSGALASSDPVNSAAIVNSPEMTLLESALALSGQKVSQADMQKQITADIEQYDATAPMAGRDARTKQALVTMGLYTPEQAQSFETQLQTATRELSQTQFTSAEEAQEAIQMKLANLPHPMGAEFSASMCTEGLGVGVLATAAIVGGFDLAATGPNVGVDVLAGMAGVGGMIWLVLAVGNEFNCGSDPVQI